MDIAKIFIFIGAWVVAISLAAIAIRTIDKVERRKHAKN